MKRVIVPPSISYLALGALSFVALWLCFQAYEVAAYLREAEAAEAAYYELTY